MKGCEDCKHYCGTTYAVDHDEYGEVRETSQCARHVLATGKCKDYEPSDKAAPAPKSLAPTETVREIMGRMEAGYIPPHKRDEEITALYAKFLKRALIREGNPVALRKVLLDAKNRLETIARHDWDWRWCLENDIRAISAALATPPRNCDVVLIENLAKRNIADIVWAAFRETHPKAYLDVPGLLQCINWLFDKAEGVSE